MSLDISTRESGDVTIVDLRGKATLQGTDEFSRHIKKLVTGGKNRILLNLAELTEIDSSGVSVIVATCASVRNRRGELILLRPRGRVLEALRVLRLLQAIPWFDDEERALASFRPKSLALRDNSQ